MTTLKIFWNRWKKIPSCRLWFLILMLSLGYLESSRAGSVFDAFADSLRSARRGLPRAPTLLVQRERIGPPALNVQLRGSPIPAIM